MSTPWDHEERKAFTPKERARIYLLNDGRCHKCTRKLKPSEPWTAEHLHALSRGGNNDIIKNMGMTCDACLPVKNAEDAKVSSKMKRVAKKHFGGKPKTKTRPMPGSRQSKFKKLMNGQTVPR